MSVFNQLWQPVFNKIRHQATLISTITVVVMMGCLGYGYAQMTRRITHLAGHEISLDYLILFSLFVAIESIYTLRRSKDLEGQEKWIFRSAEVLTLVILLKLFVLLRHGLQSALIEVSRWQADFFNAFFTLEFIAAGILLLFIWLFSASFSSNLDQLADSEQDATWDEIGKVQNALRLIRNQIAINTFIAGGLVILFAVAARLNLRSFLPILQDRFDASIPVANVIVYFLLALVLLSQTQFSLLRARWLWSKTPVAPRLGKNWLTYGTIFFLVLGVLSFLLPTNYSLGFFETLGYILGSIGYIFRFLITLALFPLSICARIFNLNETQGGELPDAPPPAPPPTPPAEETSSLWQIIQSILFWGVLVSLVVFALSQYIKTNAYLFRRMAQLPFLTWISSAWKSIWNWIKGANRAVTRSFQNALSRIRQASPSNNEFTKSIRKKNGLSTREQVIDIYLALIELGKKIGPARRDHQTPYQYSQQYISSHPDVVGEVLDLTETFNEARYSQHPIPDDKIRVLIDELRRIRKQDDEEGRAT
jgi:hypothetical protein